MATVQSNAVVGGLMPDDRKAGRVHCRAAKYVAGAALAADSVLQMIPIPKGAMVVDLDFVISAMGVARTLNVGDGGDADRYFAAIDVAAAGQKALIANGIQPGYVYTEDDTIDAIIGVDTFPAAGVLTMIAKYIMVDAIDDEDDTFSV